MTLLEVAKHALEAMEDAMYRADTHEFYDAKESLRYAIEQAEQAEQEPVAWAEEIIEDLHALYDTEMIRENDSGDALIRLDDAIACVEDAKHHYTAPTPRKPLTDEEMRECAQAMNAEPLAEGWPELIKFARAIERAHGITGETNE